MKQLVNPGVTGYPTRILFRQVFIAKLR